MSEIEIDYRGSSQSLRRVHRARRIAVAGGTTSSRGLPDYIVVRSSSCATSGQITLAYSRGVGGGGKRAHPGLSFWQPMRWRGREDHLVAQLRQLSPRRPSKPRGCRSRRVAGKPKSSSVRPWPRSIGATGIPGWRCMTLSSRTSPLGTGRNLPRSRAPRQFGISTLKARSRGRGLPSRSAS